ncbi:hypothetical protein [Sodalis glossinidius]|uniref:hypothetical protein n=1 Tax=Sodalis glossinidius TaxID=63612 RepID=UPI00031BA7A3|nr:hypothetical protein [Sodalis glossinidius]
MATYACFETTFIHESFAGLSPIADPVGVLACWRVGVLACWLALGFILQHYHVPAALL